MAYKPFTVGTDETGGFITFDNLEEAILDARIWQEADGVDVYVWYVNEETGAIMDVACVIK